MNLITLSMSASVTTDTEVIPQSVEIPPLVLPHESGSSFQAVVSEAVRTPGSQGHENSTKRPLGDTSIEEHSVAQGSKSARSDPPDFTLDSIVMFEKLQTLITRLSVTLTSRIDQLQSSLSTSITYMTNKLDGLETRLTSVEEGQASGQLATGNLDVRVTSVEEAGSDLSNRVTEIENRPPSPSSTPDWEPRGPTLTKVLLLGDSNSAGQIKFGNGRGTLGSMFPGQDVFCAKLENLPDLESNYFAEVSDIIISVGTNNLKEDGCVPTDLSRDMYRYTKALSAALPSARIFVIGVLPVNAVDSPLTIKISDYNYFLADMCDSIPRVSYIDVKVFRDRSGSMLPRFASSGPDPLHLNDQGKRLLFSRIKFALRARYSLPNIYRPNSRREEYVPGGNGPRGGGPRGGGPRGGGPRGGGLRGRGRGGPNSRGGLNE